MASSGRNLVAMLEQVPRVIRQLEQDVEIVINILKPGPLGIVEHKFTAQEVKEAESTVKKAVANWERTESFQRK